jgi:iron complex transport system substrate-binding protein
MALVAAPPAAFGATPPAPDNPLPRRIVTIAPNADEILCAIGACDRIVGCSKFTVYPPALQDRPRVGGLYDPSIERIAALKPDLVILRGNNPAVVQLCERLKVDVYEDRTDRIADIVTTVKELGERVGLAEEAKRVADEFEARIEAVRQRVAGKPRPRVFLVISRNAGETTNLLTAGADNFLTEAIEIAGGQNVFGRVEMMYPKVSAESIITARPDVIIELLPESDPLTPEQEKALAAQWAAVGDLPAVRHGRIHVITDDNALIPSPRYTAIIQRMAELLHPEPPREP